MREKTEILMPKTEFVLSTKNMQLKNTNSSKIKIVRCPEMNQFELKGFKGRNYQIFSPFEKPNALKVTRNRSENCILPKEVKTNLIRINRSSKILDKYAAGLKKIDLNSLNVSNTDKENYSKKITSKNSDALKVPGVLTNMLDLNAVQLKTDQLNQGSFQPNNIKNLNLENIKSIFAEMLVNHDKKKIVKNLKASRDNSFLQGKVDLNSQKVIFQKQKMKKAWQENQAIFEIESIQGNHYSVFEVWKEKLCLLSEIEKIIASEAFGKISDTISVSPDRFSRLRNYVKSVIGQFSKNEEIENINEIDPTFLTNTNRKDHLCVNFQGICSKINKTFLGLPNSTKISELDMKFIQDSIQKLIQELSRASLLNITSKTTFFEFQLRAVERFYRLSICSFQTLFDEFSKLDNFYSKTLFNFSVLNFFTIEFLINLYEESLYFFEKKYEESTSLFHQKLIEENVRLKNENEKISEKIEPLLEKINYHQKEAVYLKDKILILENKLESIQQLDVQLQDKFIDIDKEQSNLGKKMVEILKNSESDKLPKKKVREIFTKVAKVFQETRNIWRVEKKISEIADLNQVLEKNDGKQEDVFLKVCESFPTIKHFEGNDISHQTIERIPGENTSNASFTRMHKNSNILNKEKEISLNSEHDDSKLIKISGDHPLDDLIEIKSANIFDKINSKENIEDGLINGEYDDQTVEVGIQTDDIIEELHKKNTKSSNNLTVSDEKLKEKTDPSEPNTKENSFNKIVITDFNEICSTNSNMSNIKEDSEVLLNIKLGELLIFCNKINKEEKQNGKSLFYPISEFLKYFLAQFKFYKDKLDRRTMQIFYMASFKLKNVNETLNLKIISDFFDFTFFDQRGLKRNSSKRKISYTESSNLKIIANNQNRKKSNLEDATQNLTIKEKSIFLSAKGENNQENSENRKSESVLKLSERKNNNQRNEKSVLLNPPSKSIDQTKRKTSIFGSFEVGKSRQTSARKSQDLKNFAVSGNFDNYNDLRIIQKLAIRNTTQLNKKNDQKYQKFLNIFGKIPEILSSKSEESEDIISTNQVLPLNQLLKQIGLVYNSLSTRRETTNMNISFVIYEFLRRKYTVEKQLAKKYVQMIVSVHIHSSQSSIIKLLEIFLGIGETVEESAIGKYLAVLEQLETIKIDYLKDGVCKIDSKLLAEMCNNSFGTQRGLGKAFWKEIESLSFRDSGKLFVDFNKAMLKIVKAFDSWFKNSNDSFFKAADIDNKDDIQIMEFERIVRLVEPEFWKEKKEQLNDIFAEFSSQGTMDGNDFKAFKQKYKLFSEQTYQKFIEKSALGGIVQNVQEIIKNWKNFKQILKSLAYDCENENFDSQIKYLNLLANSACQDIEEHIWITYKLFELELDQSLTEIRTKELYFVEEIMIW